MLTADIREAMLWAMIHTYVLVCTEQQHKNRCVQDDEYTYMYDAMLQLQIYSLSKKNHPLSPIQHTHPPNPAKYALGHIWGTNTEQGKQSKHPGVTLTVTKTQVWRNS